VMAALVRHQKSRSLRPRASSPSTGRRPSASSAPTRARPMLGRCPLPSGWAASPCVPIRWWSWTSRPGSRPRYHRSDRHSISSAHRIACWFSGGLGRQRCTRPAEAVAIGHLRCLCVGGPGSSAVEVAASPPAVRFWPELAFQLHQAPDPDPVGANIRLDLGGRHADGGQVDAEQLRAPLQRRRDRPAQIRVVPSPHPSRLSNECSRSHRQCY
jgi:hypothetical protein